MTFKISSQINISLIISVIYPYFKLRITYINSKSSFEDEYLEYLKKQVKQCNVNV